MSTMSYIHYLCETNNKKELISELGSIQMAEGYLDAHKEMRENQENKVFNGLNKIVDSSIKEYKKNPKGNKEKGNIKAEISNLFTNITRVN